MMPVMARNLLSSLRILASATTLLADRCIDGLATDPIRLRALAESSPAVATALNSYLGYEEVASVVKEALREGRTVRDVVESRGHLRDGRLTQEQLDEALDVRGMAGPHD